MNLFRRLKAFVASRAKYILLGSTVFAIGLVWHFPLERLANVITGNVTKRTGVDFYMDELSFALPFGLKADDIRIERLPLPTGPERKSLHLDSLKVTVSPLSAIAYPFRKKIALTYRAAQEKVDWKGEVVLGDDLGFSAETKKYPFSYSASLAEINPLLAGSQLSLRGVADLDFVIAGKTLQLNKGDLTEGDGALDLTVKNLIADLPILKQLRFDAVEVKAGLSKGKLDIQSVKILGPDLSGSASGNIKVVEYFPRSEIDLEVKLTLGEKKREELGSLLPTFLESMNLRMDENGVLAFKVIGQLSPAHRLTLRPF